MIATSHHCVEQSTATAKSHSLHVGMS